MKKPGGVGVSPVFLDRLVGRGPWQTRFFSQPQRPGRAATDPRLLVGLWLQATIENVGSARQLERLCQMHDAYRWLCGGVTVNHHPLSDLRVEHEQVLDELMTQVIAALVMKDVVQVERISQDGRRTRASAGSGIFDGS